MDDTAGQQALNLLLRSENVTVVEYQIGFSQMGGCKVLLYYRIKDPKGLTKPREVLDDDRDS